MATYNDKLKGISTEKAVDAINHALAQCDAGHFMAPSIKKATDYKTKFVPAFMAYLGLTDVEKVPARSTLTTLYQSHLAKKAEETTKKESETYRPTTSSTRRRLAPVTKSPEDELAEKMALVRADLAKELRKLETEKVPERARGWRGGTGKCAMIRALRALGFSGDGVAHTDTFLFDDLSYAMNWAKRVLPDENCLDLASMTTALEVWLALIKYHQGLGDGNLEKQIAATRARCEALSLERYAASDHLQDAIVKAQIASAAASKKRPAKNQEADEDAERDLIECGVFLNDGQGARPGASTPFVRAVLPKKLPKLTSWCIGKPVWAEDAETGEPILVKSGQKLLKVALCGGSEFQLGIGDRRDQVPIGIIKRTGPTIGAAMVDDAWRGYLLPDGSKVSHRGRGGLGAFLVDVSNSAPSWRDGVVDYPWVALSKIGMSLASSAAVETASFGTLHGFHCVTFAEDTGGIPGGFGRLEQDYLRLMSMMRAAGEAHGDKPGIVRLAPEVPLQKMCSDGRSAAEANLRFNICAPQRCAGEVNDETLAKLNWLKGKGFEALYSVADAAARLGHVQVRVLAYVHPGAGNFHFDAAGDGPQVSKRMATALAARDPANLDSLNFSLEDCPVPARMGPVLGPK